jgi:phenylacetate-CoA ligase
MQPRAAVRSSDDMTYPNDWTEIDAAREVNFAATLDLLCRGHAATRDALTARGLSRADIRSLADLPRLPITAKADYANAPERYQLQLDDVPDEMRTVWDVMYTTGSSSGRPTPFVSTTFDFYNILLLQRRMLEIRGVRADDSIANLFPLTPRPHGAFTRVLHAGAAMNIPVVSALPGNPSPYFTLGNELDAVVDVLTRTAPTILWGVPSYMRRVLDRARERGVALPRVRLVFVTGEGVSERGREELLAILRASGAPDPAISVSYGMTEIQGGLVECRAGTGYHNPVPEQFYFEIVDPDTRAPVPDGTPGLILLTHLHRRGTVLLRYAVGDITVRQRERCPGCGRVTDRFVTVPYRADDLVKIKGMLVNPALAVAAVDGDPDVETFQFAAEKSDPQTALSMDVLRLRVAARQAADDTLAARLAERVKRAVGVTPVVEFVTAAALDGGGWKTKRFVDLRTSS